MRNILSIDFGTKRVGLASSEGQDKIAFSRKPIIYSNYKNLISTLTSIIKDEDFNLILIGLPLGLEEKETQMSNKIKKFSEDLKENLDGDIEITFWNEVFTSKLAKNNLRNLNSRDSIDSESARIFLQEFLDHNSETNEKK